MPERRGGGTAPLLVATGVFIGAGAVASDGVPGWEQRSFHAVNDLPGWLEPVLWPPMQLGSLWGPVAVGWWTWKRWRRRPLTVGVVVGGATAWQLAKAVKSLTGRGRPADELDGIARRVGTPDEGLGFVSGHTAVAVAVLTVLWPVLDPRLRLTGSALAGIVALARIHVAAHLPVDTIGGAALGVVVGEVWHLLADPWIDHGGSV